MLPAFHALRSDRSGPTKAPAPCTRMTARRSPRPVAPQRRKWHADIDRRKATKGRRMAKKSKDGKHLADELEPGEKAPAFTLPRDGGGTVSLKDFKGRNLVLYFYPKANTPGCTKESIAFSKLRAAFAKADTEILGVSADPVAAQDKFRDKHQLTIPLASDEAKEMLAAYGAWGEKSLYGRKFMGVIRKTLLIDKTGRIAKVWPKVKVEGHADDVLAAARAL
nr:peroxiredoxin [Pseudolabrys taiwanensis]